MEKLYLISNNGKKRTIYNISKNSSNNNIFKHEKIRKTEISHIIDYGITRCEDFQINFQENLEKDYQTINHGIIDVTHSNTKNNYKTFNECKDHCKLNQCFMKFKENSLETGKLLFSDYKNTTEVSDSINCYSKYPLLNETQLINHTLYNSKNQFNTLQLNKEVSQLFSQSSIFPIYNEFVFLMSNLLRKTNFCLVDYIHKESNIVKFFPRYLIYYPQITSQPLNFPIPMDTQFLISSFGYPSYPLPPIHNIAPSCNKCLLPGFHPITAWLLPPSYFEKGQLKKSAWFLNGMPTNLFNTCFSIKSMLTVESTYLFVSNLNKEEFEYCKRENFFLLEERCKESIYYFDDYKPKLGTDSEQDLILNKKSCFQNSFSKRIDYTIQNSIFCGFVCIESAEKYSSVLHERNNTNFECNIKPGDLKIHSSSSTNGTKIININEKVHPNVISDCDIFLKSDNLRDYSNKDLQLNNLEEKITLLIPRIKCLMKESRAIDSNLTILKPCYLLLWNYNIRNCNNTTKDINWINIQCKFVRLKFFGQAYENSIPINLNPHKEIILDQLNRIRNVDEARVFAWMLAGCMQHTINELLIDSYTKSLFFSNSYIRITDEINYFSNCIKSGPFSGFPDSPLDCHGRIKWKILEELVED
ncbi:unnamed protein product [Cryptosporidium hominis]|uniref:Uncharacterized protein n=1 Tax=Cryptosporidium hominis TaxID=237895 RepID=A0A0S4TEY8_CRYHO|nr:hypothetical protein ChTU502y2012_295g0430 [Cryptosporidium hominis]PPA64285.1 hypothetical protein ChUKH1_03930 [Cryptosporidium hominis]PPS96220.1 Uncharacterized protein GY17_00001708 [Cryptosporidium hominis]CUV05639.1 unnamed protein product [Cryptosporidium hominis]|eukprot:PPS96220.1 Uncharacterized protein GY17_00001708 [Cryptosporidium hominis]